MVGHSRILFYIMTGSCDPNNVITHRYASEGCSKVDTIFGKEYRPVHHIIATPYHISSGKGWTIIISTA